MTQIVDGVGLAEERVNAMRSFVAGLERAPTLVAFASEPDVPTQQFLKIKKRVAEQIGITMTTVIAPSDFKEAEVALERILEDKDGVVVQLPFSSSFDIEALLALLPSASDPDCMGREATTLLETQKSPILPPVVSAIQYICARHDIVLRGKRVVVLGQGRLVGVPGARWFTEQGAEVIRLTKSSENFLEAVAHAEILLLGAGVPGLIMPEHIREGVVLFDAGTSEAGGKVVGDADPRCREKSSLFTPVPGGIGPLAVAELFGNLLRLRFDYLGQK